MIQIKRGTTKNWRKYNLRLLAGQPGYDKDKQKIKIGDGVTPWRALPYASGLKANEIFNSEADAKDRNKKDSEDDCIITYGKESPDNNTIGQVYLQEYESEPEADYIVSFGTDGIWTYRKWHSGFAECYGRKAVTASIRQEFVDAKLYYANKAIQKERYPFKFINTPVENVSIVSPGWVAWLASCGENTKSNSGTYNIISSDKHNSATYYITINVTGFWR